MNGTTYACTYKYICTHDPFTCHFSSAKAKTMTTRGTPYSDFHRCDHRHTDGKSASSSRDISPIPSNTSCSMIHMCKQCRHRPEDTSVS